jgi:hypothetical protein
LQLGRGKNGRKDEVNKEKGILQLIKCEAKIIFHQQSAATVLCTTKGRI